MVVLMLAVVALQLLLPTNLTGRSSYFVQAVELVLLLTLVIANPRRLNKRHPGLRVTGFALLGIATLANGYAAIRLIDDILTGQAGSNAAGIIATGANVWITNVLLFAFWYWELDRGGPAARAVDPNPLPDFLFPQMTVDNRLFDDWEPRIIDYLYVSFTNSTAFSPTDTMPLSRWAKMAMMVQSALSLVIVALIVARAINVLPS